MMEGEMQKRRRRLTLFLCGTDAELRRAEARLVAGATRERATVHSPLDQEGGQTEVERQLSDAAEELKR